MRVEDDILALSDDSDEQYIYPNPVRDELHIGLKKGAYQGAQALVLNLEGKVLTETSVLSSDDILDVSALPDGQYILKLTYGNTVAFKRFLKE